MPMKKLTKTLSAFFLLFTFVSSNLFAQGEYPVEKDLTQMLLGTLIGDHEQYSFIKKRLADDFFSVHFEVDGKKVKSPTQTGDVWSQIFIWNWLYYTSQELDADLAKKVKGKTAVLRVPFNHVESFNKTMGVSTGLYLVVTFP